MEYTKEQKAAIKTRGKDLLISASAGTGKTAVLIERVASLIIEDKADISEFLIVTFTEAAAGELKTRISARLEDAIQNREGDIRHVSAQIHKLGAATISTIHGFCKKVIEENFASLSLEPGFEVLDKAKMNAMKAESFEKALDMAFEKEEECLAAFGSAASDDALQSLVYRVYAEAASSKAPLAFIEQSIEQTYKLKASGASSLLPKLREIVLSELAALGISNNSAPVDAINCEYESENFGISPLLLAAEKSGLKCYVEDAAKIIAPAKALYKLLFSFDSHNFETLDYEEIARNLSSASFDSLPRLKKADKDIVDEFYADVYKNKRNSFKKEFQTLIKNYFSYNLESLQRDLENSCDIAISLLNMTKNFSNHYRSLKMKNHYIDFDDMQHFAAEILEDENICKSYKNIFSYVFVDEYQDTSEVQDFIVEKIKGPANLFVVGDYKQSIYAFRKAKPELFLSKHQLFSKKNDGMCIELNDNFRSFPTVLYSINDVFKKLMTQNYGSLDYKNLAMLQSGRIFDNQELEQKSLITLVDDDILKEVSSRGGFVVSSPENKYFESSNIVLDDQELEFLPKDEAYLKLLIARIKKIVKNGDFTYSDICILMRSPNKNAAWIKKIFEENGVPLSIDIEENLFEVAEVNTLIDFMKIVSNPTNDIAMLSVMRSAIGSLNDDDLFELSQLPHKYYSDFLKFYPKQISENLRAKLLQLNNLIIKFRNAEDLRLSERLNTLIDDTNYTYHCLGKKSAFTLLNAVEEFVSYVNKYEISTNSSIYNILEHFEELSKKKGILLYQSKIEYADNSVKLLSIHKSKGLQFPYVILYKCEKALSKSKAGEIIFNDDGALISQNVYRKKGIKYNSLAHKIESERIRLTEIYEEMRLLYVAMTRAEFRLEIFSKLKTTTLYQDHYEIYKESIERSNSYLDWILNSLNFKGLPDKEYDELKSQTYEINDNWKINILDVGAELSSLALSCENSINFDSNALEVKAKEILEFEEKSNIIIPAVRRMTVSRLKQMATSESANNLENAVFGDYDDVHHDEYIDCMVTNSVENKKKVLEDESLKRGNSYHKFMQFFVKYARLIEKRVVEVQFAEKIKSEPRHLTTTAASLNGAESHESKSIISSFLDYNNQSEFISYGQLKLIDIEKIRNFACHDLFKRVIKSEKLWVEKPFVYKKSIEGMDYHLQGIIDLAFLESGELVIVDYKTDRTNDEAEFVRRYSIQLETYAEAIEKLTGAKVSEKLIYSFEMSKTISL